MQSPDWVLTRFILAAYPLGADRVDPPQVADDQWPDILQVARQESLSALLYASLQQLGCLARVPPRIANALRTSFWQSSVNSRLLLEEYLAFAQECARVGISSVLLKGGALGPALYPSEGTRPLADIDLLVRRNDDARVDTVLARRGFQRHAGRAGDAPELYSGQKLYSRKQGSRTFWLEAHWHVVDLPYYNQRIPIEWFWERTKTIDLYGCPVEILAPTAQVVHLCAHLAIHHAGRGLLWLYDLALLLARSSQEIAWSDVLAATRAFGLTLAVRQVLDAVCDTWHVDMPAEARRELEEWRPRAGERFAYRAMTARQVAAGPLWDGLFAPNLRFNPGYWLRSLFPNREYMRNRYRITSDLLLPFYWAIRIVEGIGKAVRSGRTAVLQTRMRQSEIKAHRCP